MSSARKVPITHARNSQGQPYAVLTVPVSSIFVGQKVPLELRIYGLEEGVRIEGFEMLSPSGYRVQGFSNPTPIHEDEYGAPKEGMLFHAAVSPQRAGEIVIGPVMVYYTTRRDQHMFMPSRRQLKSRVAPIYVQELPDGPSTSFVGVIDQCSLSLDTHTLSIGSGYTLTLEVLGQNVEALSHPLLNLPEGWRWYAAESAVSGNATKRFFYVLHVVNPLDGTIPAQVLQYFDPYEEAYGSCSTNELSVSIVPAAVEAEKSLVKEEPVRKHKEDASYMKRIRSLFIPLPWFIGLVVMALASVSCGGVVAWWRMRHKGNRSPKECCDKALRKIQLDAVSDCKSLYMHMYALFYELNNGFDEDVFYRALVKRGGRQQADAWLQWWKMLTAKAFGKQNDTNYEMMQRDACEWILWLRQEWRSLRS